MSLTRSKWLCESRYVSTRLVPGHNEYLTDKNGLQYLLPRLQAPHPPMPKKVKTAAAPGSSKSIKIQLKSTRNPTLEFTLPNAPLSTTSVEDLKEAVQGRVVDGQDSKIPLEKIKILYKRKPVSNKTVAELLSDEPDMLSGGKEVEFGVMVMGGAKVVESTSSTAAAAETGAAGEKPSPSAAVGPNGKEVLQTDAFWEDLQGYLSQRIKDVDEAQRLRTLFQSACTSTQS